MAKGSGNQDRVIDYARRHGTFRPRDVAAIGVHPEDIRRLYRKGLLRRPGRGLYELANTEPGPNQSLIEICKRAPQGVVCLLSALRVHEIGTQLPHKIWLAIPNKANRPRGDSQSIEIVYLSGKMYHLGIEQHATPAGAFRVYSIAKTVVDCFRFRNKIGLDVAVEALREVMLHQRRYKVTISDLYEMARQCRIASVMTPYMEALIG
jgi:predicted transcriptional regulator of viral defense system